ncbi:ATP-binding protein [Desulfonatronovibrio hydrogenovorans]|uniref:ATP-binding protein n=1 Tax=Desulfonatronovibrio hydrogenovorans TaxID=53245 RepID=UPI00048A7783|nr:ATP-binding protein [Desulfonatronovibrio hydrogenovorans]
MGFECRLEQTALDCSFTAETVLVEKVLEQMETFLSRKCDAKTYFKVALVLRESLNNAVIHGAGQDQSLRVGCRAALSENRVLFEISSPGQGFDWEVCMAESPVGSTSPGGWGLFLIKEYSDGFEYSESGRVLKFWFDLDCQEKSPQKDKP